MKTDPLSEPAVASTSLRPREISAPLRLPVKIVNALLSATRAFGRLNLETGGLLLADDHDIVRTLALAGESGVTRDWGLFMVSGAVVERVCEYAAEQNLRVAALVHTHRGRARMSSTDQNYGFRVDSFRSVIIPSFKNPPAGIAAWGWFRFKHGDWQPDVPGEVIKIPASVAGNSAASEPARVIVVDEGGVR